MTISTIQLREDWLMRAVAHLEPIFQRSGYQLPKVRVSIGFPSTGAKSMHLGQCWGSKASEDGVNQIFIAPNQADPVEVLDTLTHELVHAIDDCKSGHGEGFRRIAKDIGMKGPMRSAGAGERLKQDLIKIAQVLGNFPHARLFVSRGASRKGIKRPGAKCEKCGYEVVMLKSYLSYGAPICPKDQDEMKKIGEWEF